MTPATTVEPWHKVGVHAFDVDPYSDAVVLFLPLGGRDRADHRRQPALCVEEVYVTPIRPSADIAARIYETVVDTQPYRQVLLSIKRRIQVHRCLILPAILNDTTITL